MTAPLVAVVPAFQAERTVGAVVEGLRAAAAAAGAELTVLVVDDGSTDRTAARATQAGARVVSHPVNRGKGAALLTGLGAAHALGAGSVVTLDADGQHGAEDALRLALHPAPREALLLGIRDLGGAGAPRANRTSNAISNLFLSLFTLRRLRDTQCGLRRYPLPETLALGCRGTGYELEAEVLLRATAAGWPLVETPITVLYPPDRTSHFRVARDPARIVVRVVRTLVGGRGRAPERAPTPRGARAP